MGEKKPLYRTRLHSEFSVGKGFTANEQNEGAEMDSC